MKTIFILCDTLNRRMLSAYGAGEDAAITPNIDRLARRSVVFDSHWCGSAPCMPARRDIMTGRLNFLENRGEQWSRLIRACRAFFLVKRMCIRRCLPIMRTISSAAVKIMSRDLPHGRLTEVRNVIRCGRVRVRTVFVRIRRRSGLKARGPKLNVKTVCTFTRSMIIRA